nr:MAG TPA: Protein of unknown function (DUF1617) [Caudoviricetes sp.]
MKNRDIVNNLNNIYSFLESARKRQNEEHRNILKVKAQFMVIANEKVLREAYVPYEKTLNEIKAAYSEEELNDKCNELLDIERDISIETISSDDFMDDAGFDDIIALEFMTK